MIVHLYLNRHIRIYIPEGFKKVGMVSNVVHVKTTTEGANLVKNVFVCEGKMGMVVDRVTSDPCTVKISDPLFGTFPDDWLSQFVRAFIDTGNRLHDNQLYQVQQAQGKTRDGEPDFFSDSFIDPIWSDGFLVEGNIQKILALKL